MKTSTKILSAIILISFGVIWYLWTHPKIEEKYIPVGSKSQPPVITYSEGKNGNQVATIVAPKPVLEPKKEASEQLLNTVKNIKEIDEKTTITELTKYITQLEVRLVEKDMVINDKDKQLKSWKDEFNEITVDNAKNIATSKSDVSPVVAEYEKRPKWYKAKEGYISMISENPSIRFNGVEKYEMKKKEIKDIFELTANADTGQFFYDKKFVQGLRFYDAELELTGNPDGKLRFFANAGLRTYDFKFYSPYYQLGVKFLITKY